MKILTRRKATLPNTATVTKEESTPKKQRKSCKNLLPSDEYRDEIPPKEVLLTEDGNNKLVVSVKRGGEFGLPKVDIRLFVTSDVYTGFTKKGINFNLNRLPKLKSLLCDVIEECDEKGLFNEFDED